MQLDSNDFLCWLEGFLRNIKGDMPKGHVDFLKDKMKQVKRIDPYPEMTRFANEFFDKEKELK